MGIGGFLWNISQARSLGADSPSQPQLGKIHQFPSGAAGEPVGARANRHRNRPAAREEVTPILLILGLPVRKFIRRERIPHFCVRPACGVWGEWLESINTETLSQ